MHCPEEPLAQGLMLAEGPMWNPWDGSFSFVDILSGTLYLVCGSLLSRDHKAFRLSSRIGAALPAGPGSYIVVIKEGIFHFNAKGQLSLLSKFPETNSSLRPNDAKIGPDGCLWYGLMSEDEAPGAGTLWRFDGRQHSLLLEGLTIPNGMDWREGEFYFVDGPKPEIQIFANSTARLKLIDRIKVSGGVPDGLTIDSEGVIWCAVWGGSQVKTFSAASRAWISAADVGAKFVTSLILSGGQQQFGVITTACRLCATGVEHRAEQHDGAAFLTKSHVKGLAPTSPGFKLPVANS